MGFILVYFVIMMLVIEIAVVLMRSTGLDHDISRFQVVSLMTSTGFTTKESELILGHPIRRRIGIFLILFGVFSFAVIISAISSFLVSHFKIVYLALISAVLAGLLGLVRLPAVQRKLIERFAAPLQQKFEVHELPIEEVMLHESNDLFVDVPIGEGSTLIGKTMEKVCGDDTDVNLLFIKRGTVHLRDLRMRTNFEAGDVLYLYGNKEDIDRIFARELQERLTLREHEIESKSLV
ncbi:hypothetical protein E5161_11025 [Cohnella pontilimi]|uniref:RCK C-terminal domain-containing protein n=1 Tax=Cohnella pontilimi TaxID=2564100 RepID=A0A4U0FB00_9BACL|nr:TrkA C-terminal domain-containing protein [Cohnella pontilimi]TJY41738.1 hypothetical protein E5161_11025 [Cohnella pontilimi]